MNGNNCTGQAPVTDWDTAVRTIIADALDKVGKDGTVIVEETKSTETTLAVVNGMRLDMGYCSPYFVTNAETMEGDFEDAYILIYDKKISKLSVMLSMLEKVAKTGKPLLIIAEDIEGEALATLVVNKLRGIISVAAAKVPRIVGGGRRGMMEDIAIFTGGRYITEELPINTNYSSSVFDIPDLGLYELGKAKRITFNEENTTIFEGAGTKKDIQSRAAFIRRMIEETSKDGDRRNLQERLARFTSTIAFISVGGTTEADMKRKRVRVHEMLESMRAAIGT